MADDAIKNDIIASIKARLQKSEYWTTKTNDNGKSIKRLICPECGDSEAWAYSVEPWSINCNRLNECGVRTKTLKIFPEIIQNVEKENPPCKEDPNRPATAYLHSRGLYESLKGLSYEYWKDIRRTGSGGVMFPVIDGVYNGRIFNPPHGEDKAHNKGSTSGVFWKHPGREYDRNKFNFVTEGIINALSLWEMGFQAIAVLASGQDPSKVNLPEHNIIFAFDPDEAGTKALKKWKEHYPNAGAYMPIKGDWNDLLLSDSFENVKKYFNEHEKEFECRARLALAEDAEKYADIYQEHYKRAPGLFTFRKSYYFSHIVNPKDGSLKTYRVSNFTLEVDHYQLDNSNPEEPVNRYYLKIKPAKGWRPVRCTVSANEIASPGGFTQMFLTRARVLWEGDKQPSMALTRRIIEAGAPVVRQLQVTGYDKESDCYIFKDFAINRKGEMVLPNSKGFFELSRSDQIRPAQYPTINPIKGTTPKEVYTLIYQAWGNQGIIEIAWEVAGFFVHRIKKQIGFFPFLSSWGATQVGKSMLARIMNALQCFDEEGLPTKKVNTGKGEIRKLAQRAGLFKALLESNNEDNIRFDLDALLTMFNDNPLQVRALKSNDIQTVEIPFQSSLLFVQNREPFKTKAQKERVVSVQFKEENLTPETSQAFNKLIQIPISEMAYFFPFVMKHREAFESKWFDAFQQARNDIKVGIGDARITDTHALILAFHRLLCEVLRVEYDLKPCIEEIGRRKKIECRARNENTADIFFDIINKIDPSEAWFMDDEEEGLLYVNLNEALQKIKQDGTSFFVTLDLLQKSLREHPAFISNNKSKKFTKILGQTTEKKS